MVLFPNIGHMKGGFIPEAKGIGPINMSACPNCLNSFQNGVPQDRPDLKRCATCKTIFRQSPEEE